MTDDKQQTPEDEAQALQITLDAAGLPWQVFPLLQEREVLYRAERIATEKREVLHASPRVLRRLIEEAESRIDPKTVPVKSGQMST